MAIIEISAFIILILYCTVIFLFYIGWIRIKPYKQTKNNLIPNISIVVACRNEEKNILHLLQSIDKQEYPKINTKVIIVDDHSTDQTKNIIRNYIKGKNYYKLCTLPDNKQGKKDAIMHGVSQANSEIIITSDADCSMGTKWISSMVSYYTEHKPKLLSGPVCIADTKSWFTKIQALEFSSLVASGAGAIGINHAIMCNGANLLFEKSIYLESNKFEHYASGDDVFLMLHIKRSYSDAIKFLKSPSAIVYTNAQPGLKDFFNQRIRWTSKSKAYKDFDLIFTSLVVAALNILLAFFTVAMVLYPSFLKIFMGLFAVKSFFDLVVLFPFLHFCQSKKLLWLFLPLQFVYPFYIMLTVLAGMWGKFHWKNRKSE